MNDSPKNGRNGSSRKTKAQLEQELAEAHTILEEQENELIARKKELEQTQNKIKELEELKAKLKQAEEKLEQLRDVREENAELKKQIRKIEESAATQIKHANTNIRELERQIQNFENEIKRLKEEAIENEKELPREEMAEDFSTPKATFLIHLYQTQERYQGKIEHPLTRDKKAFIGLDQNAISEFILNHLPQLAEEEKDNHRRRKAELTIPLSEEKPKKMGVLKEIKFEQKNKMVEPGQALLRNLPFILCTHLHFPITPSPDNMNIATSAYEVMVLVKDADDKNVITRKDVADMLSFGISDYEQKINMTGLTPGKYLFQIQSRAFYAKISESESFEIMVQ